MTTDPDQLSKKFWQVMEQMSDEDRQKLNRAPIETSASRPARIISLSIA